MDKPKRDRIRAWHQPYRTEQWKMHCRGCIDLPHPCIVIKLLDAYDRMEAQLIDCITEYGMEYGYTTEARRLLMEVAKHESE